MTAEEGATSLMPCLHGFELVFQEFTRGRASSSMKARCPWPTGFHGFLVISWRPHLFSQNTHTDVIHLQSVASQDISFVKDHGMPL